jgi:hypothetical protein
LLKGYKPEQLLAQIRAIWSVALCRFVSWYVWVGKQLVV